MIIMPCVVNNIRRLAHRQKLARCLFLAAMLAAGCNGLTNSGLSKNGASGSESNPPPTVTVAVSPASANVRAGSGQSFTATVSGTSNMAVTWQVNGVTGGTASTGTITQSGAFTAPVSVPSPNTVTVSAVNANATGSAVVTLLNPVPTLAGVSPATVSTGSFAISVSGSNFVSGAQVLLSGSPLATNFVSSTQLSANGSASPAGMFAVTVLNPNPGSSTSNAMSLEVTSASGGGGAPPPPVCSAIGLGQGGSLNGFVPFPADNAWNRDISSAPVDPNSAAIINFIGPNIPVHPDFGSGLYNGSSMGIPYLVVGSQQGPVTINFTAYGDESDLGPMPIPVTAEIEGYPAPGNGDRHVLVLDNNNCWLYELYSSYPNATSWDAASAAVWDLTADEQRPWTWTSADAAGLPIFPGLARYDEVAAGQISHALRFTLQNSRAAFVPPATHWAATSSNAMAAPMGMRMRLKASFDTSGFSGTNQVLLAALKKYGMIMADNGSSMYISGAPDDRWNNDDLHLLDGVTASDFEVIQMSPIYTEANVPTGAPPAISSFTASSQMISASTPVTLTWSVAGASYVIVSPDVGAVRGTSVSIAPTQSTTYTLYATNAYGRSTMSVNITVH